MSGLWARLIRGHRIVAQATAACEVADCKEALVELCKGFDAPAPIWLSKHEREFERFLRTAFTNDHFIEAVLFDRLEIEYLAEGGARRESDDPRNRF